MASVALAIAVFVVPLGFGATALLAAGAQQDTERVALEAAFRVGPSFTSGDPVELGRQADGDLGLYSVTGRRVGGTGPATLERGAHAALTGAITRFQQTGAVVAAVPVVANEAVIGVVRASRPSGLAALSLAVWGALLGIAGAIAAGSALLARRTAAQLASPVERLGEAARRMGDGHLLLPAPSSSIDEIDEAHAALVDAGARIADLIEREQRIAADASHQLRTPLSGLRAELEMGLVDPARDRRTLLTESLAQVDRLDSTIENLIALARRPGSADRSEPKRLLEEAVGRWGPAFESQGRQVSFELDHDGRLVAAPPTAVGVVLDVLLDNALRHGGGPVELTAHRNGGVLTLDVTSSAPYAGPEDPFADGASGTGGSGLGLGIARRTAQDFGGRLLLTETEPRTRFSLLLPAAEGTPSPAPPRHR